MSIQAAAQRKTFKGKYKGPDRFKGDQAKIATWKAAKAAAASHTFPATEAKPEKSDTPTNTFNAGTATDIGKKLVGKYPLATKTYKGKYAGKDKYKGVAQKGQHKGKYIGLESRKGLAKPTVTPSNASTEEEVLKRLIQ